jgi:hypothetical protein
VLLTLMLESTDADPDVAVAANKELTRLFRK